MCVLNIPTDYINLISKGQSDFLNFSRWVAAGLVVVEHARNLLFVDYASVVSPTVLQNFFYFMTGFGHEAVVVFFVISGFLVGGKALADWQDKRFCWRRYLVNRISRLYAVLLAALILGACLDLFGLFFWFLSRICGFPSGPLSGVRS